MFEARNSYSDLYFQVKMHHCYCQYVQFPALDETWSMWITNQWACLYLKPFSASPWWRNKWRKTPGRDVKLSNPESDGHNLGLFYTNTPGGHFQRAGKTRTCTSKVQNLDFIRVFCWIVTAATAMLRRYYKNCLDWTGRMNHINRNSQLKEIQAGKFHRKGTMWWMYTLWEKVPSNRGSISA